MPLSSSRKPAIDRKTLAATAAGFLGGLLATALLSLLNVRYGGYGPVSLALLPAVSVGNGPPPPAAWRYLREPDKKRKDDDKAPAGKELRVVENAPVAVNYRLDVTRPRIVIPQKFALVEGKAGAAPKAEADPPASRHLFAGLALSGAFISGGFWLVRRSGKAGKGRGGVTSISLSPRAGRGEIRRGL